MHQKNKRVWILFALSTLALPAVHAADFAYLINITQTTFLPTTIHSGDLVSLAMDIQNRGIAAAITDLNAQLDLGNQFESIKITDFISYIAPNSTKTLVFQFRVKPGTIAGYYPLSVDFNYTKDNAPNLISEKQTVTVPVFTSQKNLDITVQPNVISPSVPTQLVFVLQNFGDLSVSNLSISWEEKNNLVLPVGSDNKRYLAQLDANQAAQVVYTVVADPNITTGVYPLNITISFVDNNGTQTKISQVGLIVGGTTDFEVSADPVNSGQLSVSVANIGSNNAGALVVKIPPQQTIRIMGSNTAILGNLNKGDFSLANFQVFQPATDQNAGFGQNRFQNRGTNAPTGTVPTANTLIVEIDYTDTTGQRQIVQKTISLSAPNNANAPASGGNAFRQRNSTVGLAPWALLILTVGTALAFNRFGKTSKDWKKLGLLLLLPIALFLTDIFLFDSNPGGAAIATLVSVAALVWFFKTKTGGR